MGFRKQRSHHWGRTLKRSLGWASPGLAPQCDHGHGRDEGGYGGHGDSGGRGGRDWSGHSNGLPGIPSLSRNLVNIEDESTL